MMAASAASGAVTAVLDREAAMVAVMAASAESEAVAAVVDREAATAAMAAAAATAAVKAAMVAVMAASAESEAVAAVVDREAVAAATAATAATAAAAAVKAARAKQVAVAASMRTLGGGGCRKVSGHKQMPQVHTRNGCRCRARTGLPNARTHCRSRVPLGRQRRRIPLGQMQQSHGLELSGLPAWRHHIAGPWKRTRHHRSCEQHQESRWAPADAQCPLPLFASQHV